MCTACHGPNGENTVPLGSPIPLNPANRFTYSELVTIINDTMPSGFSSSCVGTCAENIAQYMLDAFWDDTLPARPLGAGSSAGITDLSDNGGVETGVESWLRVGENVSLAQSNAQAHGGLYSLLVFDRQSAFDGAGQQVTGLVAGETYRVAVWVRLNAGADRVTLQVNAATGAGSQVLAEALVDDAGWVELSGLYQHPEDAGESAIVYLDGPEAGAMFYLDSLSLVRGR